MSAINERNISRFLFNPFSVYLADYVAGQATEQPVVPSFFTENAMTFSFNREFVKAEAYDRQSNGILYTVRQDLQRFALMAKFSIKESSLKAWEVAVGGTRDSNSENIIFDGTTDYFAAWFESCYNDDGKIIRIIIPRCRSTESVEVATGDKHLLLPVSLEALPDISDSSTLPRIYVEP